MRLRWTIVAMLAVGSCSRERAIIGRWDEVCRTEHRATRCLGRTSQAGRWIQLGRDGTYVDHDDQDYRGTWSQRGETLTTRIDAPAAARSSSRYDVSLDHDQLALHEAALDFTRVFTREGVAPVFTPTEPTAGGPTTDALDGVTFSLTLPLGYRLVEHKADHETWSLNDERLRFTVRVSRDYSSPAERCAGKRTWLSESPSTDENAQISIDLATCYDGGDIACTARTLGGRVLTPAEIASAHTVCETLHLAR